jgi:hypothetical protein
MCVVCCLNPSARKIQKAYVRFEVLTTVKINVINRKLSLQSNGKYFCGNLGLKLLAKFSESKLK